MCESVSRLFISRCVILLYLLNKYNVHTFSLYKYYEYSFSDGKKKLYDILFYRSITNCLAKTMKGKLFH